MLACLLSVLTFSATGDCVAALTITSSGLVILGTVLYRVYLFTFYRDHNFYFSFINHLPLEGYDTPMVTEWGMKVIPPGTHHLYLELKSRLGFKIKKFNIRPLDENWGKVSRNTARIADIQGLKPEFDRVQDGFSGLDCEYETAKFIRRKSAIYLDMTFICNTEWKGKISFRAENEDGLVSFARHILIVKNGASPLKDYQVYRNWVYSTASDTMPAVQLWSPPIPTETSQAGMPPNGFISMKDAATELYTYARGKKHLISRFAEETSGWKNGRLTDGSPDDVLDYAATYIAFCKRVPIVGKRVPSTAFESISFDEVRRCTFADGTKKLERTHNASIYYVDVAVRKDAFDALMGNVGVDDGYYGPD